MKRWTSSNPWVALVLLASTAIVLCAIFGNQGLVQVLHLRRENQLIEKRALELSERNQLLRRRVARLKSDPALTERIAREQLGFARSQEIVFRLAQ